MDIKTRIFQQEKLDNLSLSGKELYKALNSLAWVNRWFGNHLTIIKAVEEILERYPEKNHINIVDLGCGGGDVMLKLAEHLKRKKVHFRMIGIDGNLNSLVFAQEKTRHIPEITYLQANILNQDFVVPDCDILISSHFLYHFQSQKLGTFIGKNIPSIRLAIVNSGLERRKWAFMLFRTFSFILPMSQLAREDGLLAIRRAFTRSELIQEVSVVPNLQVKVERVPLFRLKMLIFPAS